MTLSDRINNGVANSVFGRHFQLEGSGAKKERLNSKFLTELRGGLATFVAMVSVHHCIIMLSDIPILTHLIILGIYYIG
jgi:hypothetical protein